MPVGATLMVARGDGSVALFLAVSEMHGQHAHPRATIRVAPTDVRGIL